MHRPGEFSGAALRLARLFGGFTLEDVAERVSKTRQYLHKLETGQSSPTAQLLDGLSTALQVEPEFFWQSGGFVLAEEQVHFRKLFTTRVGVKQAAMARAEMMGRLVTVLQTKLQLPEVRIPTLPETSGRHDVERVAEHCRSEWDLGAGPVSDMTRLAELIGAVVTSFRSISREIDAMSFAFQRPIIVRNEAKESACRQRFDIGHELAHAVLHPGQQTGDHETETEAHRFAAALLVPRAMMLKHFPRPRGRRLDWIGLSAFKRTWKISKAAALYRARLLEMISEVQYRSAVITLQRSGQAQRELEDGDIPMEQPTLLRTSFQVLADKKRLYGSDIARSLNVSPALLQDLVGFPLPTPTADAPGARTSLRLVA